MAEWDLTKGRTCTICKTEKDRHHFYPHPTGKNGLQPNCKTCHRERDKGVKKRLYQRRKQGQICVKCRSPRMPHHNLFCEACWVYDRAVYVLGGPEHVVTLHRIWDRQQGRCRYTGELLTPGLNASIDHIVPRSRGGDNSEANLQWVTRQINLMKTDMTHDEFLSTCELVLRRSEWTRGS